MAAQSSLRSDVRRSGPNPKTLLWRLSGWWEQRRHPIDVAALMADFSSVAEPKPATRSSARKRRVAAPGCPTPYKVAYASLSAARTARNSARNKGDRMKAYRCPCGEYHLARRES